MFTNIPIDLLSPSIRAKYFQNRSVSELMTEFPILPVDAPGLPPPGPSFVRLAHHLGDRAADAQDDSDSVDLSDRLTPELNAAIKLVAKVTRRKKGSKKQVDRPSGPHLTALVRSALYQDRTPISVEIFGRTDSYDYRSGLFAKGGLGRETTGPAKCRLMVVGKCLGSAEINTGRPFSSPSSKPLWAAWRESGLRAHGPSDPVFMTNLVPFAPPPAAVSRLSKEWVDDGRHLLFQAFAVCRPEVVLVLGADVLKAIFGVRAKVEDYRGRYAEWSVDCRPSTDDPPDVHTAVVVVGDHPAAVYNDPDLMPGLINSFRLVARRLGHIPDDRETIPLDHRPIYTAAELEVAVAESVAVTTGGGAIAFDCEWDGKYPTDSDAYLYTVQWSHGPGHARVVYLRRCGGIPNPALTIDQAKPLFNRLLAHAPARGARLLGHFAKSDLPWLASIGVDLYPHFVGPDDDPNPDGRERFYDWQKCKFQGAFDTYVAAHAHEENATKKLEILTSNTLGLPRWDLGVIGWKERYCKEKKIKLRDLTGYGNLPEDVLQPYASWDVDAVQRLYRFYNGDPYNGIPGALDADRFGNSCRQIFATRMRAWAALAEMERYGLYVDYHTHHKLRDVLLAKKTELISAIREQTDWTERDGFDAFDPNKPTHRIEILFGEEYLEGKQSRRPPGALALYLAPYKSTDKTKGKLWPEAMYRFSQNPDSPRPVPSTDKETLIHLARRHPIAALLRDIDTIKTATKILFRPPDDDQEYDEESADSPDVGEEHSKGLLAEVCADGRVRSTFGLVETGRLSSSRPNLQNLTGSVDEQYDRILGWGKAAPEGSPEAKLHFSSKSIFVARPGWFLVTTDLKGAEIVLAAAFSGDLTLLDHARRNNLPEDDPEWLDLHSDLANTAFGLNLPLGEVKKKHKALRVAAKRSRFGHYYGAFPDTILRQALEESADVTLEQIETIVTEHDRMYPKLAEFFAACRERATKPGWLCNGYGGYRRFRPAGDRDLISKQGREAQNWSCQGGVADVISRGLGNLWFEMRRRKMIGRIVLSVHDSVTVECPPEEVVTVADELYPLCLSERAPIIPTDLSGNPLPRGPYNFALDVTVGRTLGEELPDAEWRALVARK